MKKILSTLYFTLRMMLGDSRKWQLVRSYYKRRGHRPDFDHPSDLSEYLMGNILYKRNDAFAPLADKVEVKHYVASKGLGHIVPELYGVWDDPAQIDFDTLPDRFALKVNLGWGGNLFCRDPHTFDRARAVKKLRRWLRGGRSNPLETHYDLIKPKVFAEEFIDDGSGRLPIDYKFMCLRGEPFVVLACSGRDSRVSKYLFDLDWNPRSDYLAHPAPDGEAASVPRPANLETMKEYARVLARDFDFVRVDLYDTGTRRVFLHASLTASTEQKAQCAEKNGFSGPRFAGDYVEMWPECHVEPVDQGVIFNRKGSQHNYPCIKTTASAATPSSRPTKPRRSVVVALTETFSAATPIAAASSRRISSI